MFKQFNYLINRNFITFIKLNKNMLSYTKITDNNYFNKRIKDNIKFKEKMNLQFKNKIIKNSLLITNDLIDIDIANFYKNIDNRPILKDYNVNNISLYDIECVFNNMSTTILDKFSIEDLNKIKIINTKRQEYLEKCIQLYKSYSDETQAHLGLMNLLENISCALIVIHKELFLL